MQPERPVMNNAENPQIAFKIDKIYTEYQENPMGLDVLNPRFSWKLSSNQNNIRQAACQIQVLLDTPLPKNQSESQPIVIWDSGKQYTDCSSGMTYSGPALSPCTRYSVHLSVWEHSGCQALQAGWFETGLLDTGLTSWNGAQWICAPAYTVYAAAKGVFQIESDFRFLDSADRGGIVFGADDARLMDEAMNEYRLHGKNYIRYEVNIQNPEKPQLHIYRVGYAVDDDPNIPLEVIPLIQTDTGACLLTPENIHDFHTLTIKVTGNNAQVYFDHTYLDSTQLNPRGSNDVLTYPRLNNIGFFAGPKGKVCFKNYTVSHIRAPYGIFIDERPAHGLCQKASIFAGKIRCKDDCFILSDAQITADPSNTGLPMLRRSFYVKPQITRARLYITACGIYDVCINQTAVTQRFFPPGLTQYDRRMNYQTYDITPLLKTGENAIGVVLASGWWSDAQTFTVQNYNYFGDREALLCKLVIDYADRTSDVIVSEPANWAYSGDGPYRYAGFFMGEYYDARQAHIYNDFSSPDFNPSGWIRPETYVPAYIPASNPGFARDWPEVHKTSPLLEGSYDAPVFVVDTLTAVSRVQQREDIFIYDFGQEMAGIPQITFHEAPGTVIKIRYSEMLYPDLSRYAGNVGRLMRENYRDAESTDIYVCTGSPDGETYCPKFTFHGFRYMELSGVSTPPEVGEVKGLQLSSVTEFTGYFECSEPLLNRFVQNVRWSQLCNFINIPTDCPQRNERMGWAGDTHVFCSTALHNSNLKLFYERVLQAMADLQEESGRYPEIAPVGGGFGGITYECASIFITWELYQQYGDIQTIQAFYPGMKKYMQYMEKQQLPGNGNPDTIGPLTDWLAFEETDAQLMWNIFYYREVFLMEKFAKLLDLTEDEEKFRAIRKQTAKYWNQTFLDPVNGLTRAANGTICDTQCSYALALAYNIADHPRQLAGHLARKIKESGNRIKTGFFGTGLISRALSANGYSDVACRLMLQTAFPSWLYPVTQGATTIWEHWDSYTTQCGFGSYNTMNSFNHYALGSVLSWIYEEILGIKKQPDCPGYKHFILKPCLCKQLSHARGCIDTIYGPIKSGWKKQNGQLTYFCSIPANTTAVLYLPNTAARRLGSGNYTFTEDGSV